MSNNIAYKGYKQKLKYSNYIFLYMQVYENFNIIPFPFNELKNKLSRKHKLIQALNRVMSEYFDNNMESLEYLTPPLYSRSI